MWKLIYLDGTRHLFQHRVNGDTGGYEIFLTDLKVLYSQSFDLDEFAKEFHRLNKNLEISNYEEVLTDMFSILDGWVQSQRSKSLSSSAALKFHIKGMPLSFKIRCRISELHLHCTILSRLTFTFHFQVKISFCKYCGCIVDINCH